MLNVLGLSQSKQLLKLVKDSTLMLEFPVVDCGFEKHKSFPLTLYLTTLGQLDVVVSFLNTCVVLV